MFQSPVRAAKDFLASLTGSKEDPQLTDFRDGIEREMAKDERLADCPETRMVSNFFQIDPKFCGSMYSTGYRTPDNGQYNFVRAAAFIADIDRHDHIEDGRAVPFLGIEKEDGTFELLDVSNYASPHKLKDLNGDAARRMVNAFRNILEGSNDTTMIAEAPDRLFFANKSTEPELVHET